MASLSVRDSLLDKTTKFRYPEDALFFMSKRRSEIISDRKREEPTDELYWEQTYKNYVVYQTLVINGEKTGIQLIAETV
jgi:hypothetical protein